jgi:hypothetical protein
MAFTLLEVMPILDIFPRWVKAAVAWPMASFEVLALRSHITMHPIFYLFYWICSSEIV